jgi:threonine dehydrogenase-like Zn-dependent dehydrogenase
MLATRQAKFKIVAIDLLEPRRKKAQAFYDAIHPSGRGSGEFVVASAEEAKQIASEWTGGVGLNGVLEVVGHTSALTLAYDLIRPFGVITSVGVHTSPPVPFTGAQMYDKNVSLDFGRCPVRALFPTALELLVKRQDVFGSVGGESSLVDKILPLSQAKEAYAAFEKGECGKVLFDPWI